jgi:hypothetical protein
MYAVMSDARKLRDTKQDEDAETSYSGEYSAST